MSLLQLIVHFRPMYILLERSEPPNVLNWICEIQYFYTPRIFVPTKLNTFKILEIFDNLEN